MSLPTEAFCQHPTVRYSKECDNFFCTRCDKGMGQEYYNKNITAERMNINNQKVDLGYDPVNHPAHYTTHPSKVECIAITEHMNFCLGNAIKYIWRASEKGKQLEDLKKARWYLDREISRLENVKG